MCPPKRAATAGKAKANTAVDARCRIELFGGMRLVQQDRTITRFRTHKAAHLLAYLALHLDQNHARERLTELFWPEMQTGAGRDNLSTTLSSLRRQIEPPGVPAGSVLVSDRQDVGLNPAAVSTDVAEFDRLTRAAARTPGDAERISLLERAVGLYRGELLPGCYEEWALQEQTRRGAQYVDALQAWAAALERIGEPEAALDAVSRALAADPYREELYRLQMRTLVDLGRVGAAQESYRKLESLFQAELGVSPSAATRVLAERLRREPEAFTAPAPAAPSPPLPPPAREPNVPALPLQLTRFFGRASEIEHLERLLRDENVRLVTLTGAGGSGKTRLSIEVAGRLASGFAGRVWFVDLAGVPAPHLIPFALSHVLKLPPDSGADPLQRAIQTLGEAPCLLVLDNFEHLLGGSVAGLLGGASATGLLRDAGAQTKRDHPAGDSTVLVRLLLERVPGLTCLITSRQPLHLGGERECPVAPLPVPVPSDSPDASSQKTPERLLQLASVALYADRAQAVRPDFAVTAANAEAVARLCRKLEGMPLAIEMAAAWAKTLPPAAMLERLERQLALLISRRRDLPPRHQSLRATIEWSYALLPAELGDFFAALSVFRGGWTLAAAEAVCGTGALVSLSELAERSLLVWDEPSEGPSAGGRYRLLEPLREFAEEKLSESGGGGQARRAHAAYFLALAEEARSYYKGPEEAFWLKCLEGEIENLRSALRWCWNTCEQPGGAEVAQMLLRLATALDRFWEVRGYAADRCHWLEGSLSKAPERTEARAWALCVAGRLARGLGDPERAQRHLDESLAIMREIGDRRGVAEVLMGLGLVASHHGDFEAAQTLHEESLAIVRALGNKASMAESLYLLGSLARSRGDLAQARALWEECRAMDQAAGVRAGYVLMALAQMAKEQGDYAEAARLLGIRLRECYEIGQETSIGDLLFWLAEVTMALGQPERSARLYGTCVAQKEALARRTGSPLVRAKMFDDFADAVRAALGGEAFAAAWAEGQAMTLERTIAEVCEGALVGAPG